MQQRGKRQRLIKAALAAVLFASAFWARVPIANAVSAAEQTFLALYFTEEELTVISSTRSLQSISRIAENMQVIPAAEIALLQAHSLAEVLETVSGIAIEKRGGPGSVFTPYIQGSTQFGHVAAFLDGIPLNNIGTSFPELTFLPVEEVARIEIVKGPASSAWGSALGGVINVITKNPPAAEGHGGSVSASAGSSATSDLRATVAGRAGAFGYALTAGRLHSNGLVDGYAVARNTVTTRLDYRPAAAWHLGLAVYGTDTDRGDGLYPEYDEADRNEARHLRGQITAAGTLAGGLLDVNLWAANNRDDYIFDHMSDGSEFYRGTNTDKMRGGGLRYRRTLAGHEVVLGGDYLTGRSELPDVADELIKREWALYGNDTFDVGPVTVTAGVRRDELRDVGSFWSPSLGAVCPLGGHLLLRAFVGRGFTAPGPGDLLTNEEWSYRGNPDLQVEKVLSYQGGVEGDLPGFLWYKISLFRHDSEDGIAEESLDDGTWTKVNRDEIRRQGVEFDAKSASFHGLVLEGGATFVDMDNETSGNDDIYYANATSRVGLSYTGSRGTRVLLRLHRTHWETPPDYQPAADPIADLHVSQEIPVGGLRLELYGSAHNLFDGDQYFKAHYPTAGRWLEGGLRLRF